MPQPIRKPNRLPAPAYSGFHSYLITICAYRRRPLFTSPDLVNIAKSALLLQSEKHSFSVHAFCFMPDHCHIVLIAESEFSDLPAFIRAFKGATAAAARTLSIYDLWQKGFHDHLIRTSDELGNITNYVFQNPVRAGGASSIYDWSYSGSFAFDWREFAPPKTEYLPPWKHPKPL